MLHDRDDEVIPWSDGEAITAAWPGAKLVTTVGLGHRRIVREPEVVSRAVAFLLGDPAAGPAPAAPRASDGEGHWLDQHFFYRDTRLRPSRPSVV